MKNVRIYIRVETKTKDKINKLAEKAHLNLTDYMTSSALNTTIIVVEGLPKLLKSMSQIGNNINQIARMANTNSYISKDEVKEVKGNLKEINEMIYKFIKDLK
jgi:hypothetical protein